MIAWTLTLSGQQIALLKMFSTRVEGAKWWHSRDDERAAGVHPNTIPGCRTLVREGLLEHREVKQKSGYIDLVKSGYFITARGKFILDMIQQDIDKYLRVEDQVITKRRKLRAVS